MAAVMSRRLTEQDLIEEYLRDEEDRDYIVKEHSRTHADHDRSGSADPLCKFCVQDYERNWVIQGDIMVFKSSNNQAILYLDEMES